MIESEWWQGYADLLPPWFTGYLAYEQAASSIETYETQFVPGLLQTADYARAVIRLAHHDPEEIERRVELRMARSRRLLDDGGPTISAVINESALALPGLTPEQARAQVDQLDELGRRPTITIGILPPAGDGVSSDEPFTLLRFPEPASTGLVYLEQAASARYVEEPEDVRRYAALFERLSGDARPQRSRDDLHR
jgi:hypothetical protein